jgi:S-DNA-T family DNA segregation ATPase FtsK/SpoIIIE
MTYSLNTLTTPRGKAAPARAGAGRFAHEFALVLGVVALVFWLLALASYSAQDPAFSTSGTGAAIHNWGGRLGAGLADASYFLLGFSVWWCFVAGVRAWLAALARWMRGGEEPQEAPQQLTRTRWAFWAGLALLHHDLPALEAPLADRFRDGLGLRRCQQREQRHPANQFQIGQHRHRSIPSRRAAL